MMFFWPINFFVACNKFKLPCYVIKGRSRTTTRSDWNETGRAPSHQNNYVEVFIIDYSLTWSYNNTPQKTINTA